MNWLQRRREGWREISNLVFVRKIIKKNKDSESWKEYNLRTGYLNQIYTVISLRKEDMGEEEMVQRMKVMEKIEPMNNYLAGLNLAEIVYPDIVKLPDTQSWLIVYWPLRNYFSWWRLLFQILVVIGIYAGAEQIGLIDYLRSFI
jgi:hypothetical protein